MLCTSYIFQAGQPEWLRKEYAEVMGIEAREFDGIVASRNSPGGPGSSAPPV